MRCGLHHDLRGLDVLLELLFNRRCQVHLHLVILLAKRRCPLSLLVLSLMLSLCLGLESSLKLVVVVVGIEKWREIAIEVHDG